MQKFHKGDLVRVAKDQGPGRQAFQGDCEAIVIGSYSDEHGRSMEHHDHKYTIFIQNTGTVSWYGEEHLSLIKGGCLDLLAQWQDDVVATREQEADLDWIFAQGPQILSRCSGATARGLAACLTEKSLWGSHGESLAFQQNALAVLTMAKPFLEKRDKAGWLDHCAKVKASVR